MIVALFALAAGLTAAVHVLSIRANPGVRLSAWRNPPRTPTATRVLTGLATFSAILGAINISSDKSGTPADFSWWSEVLWGLMFLVVALVLPAVLVHLSVGLHRRLRSHRETAQAAR